jgi:FkbM family methyltransferase
MYESLITSAYIVLLGRGPDPEGFAYWSKMLQDGISKEQFLYNIVHSDEFQQKRPGWLDLGLWQTCQDLKADITLNLPIGKFCGPATDGSVFASILRQEGAYEPHVAKEITQHLKSGDTFVDIGANLGYFTLLASKLLGTSGKVISFEPVTEAYNYCRRNIEANKLTNATLYKNGLWSEKKTLNISQSLQLGGSHISDTGDSIECIPLDSLNLAPNMIKMDIEGAEPYALQGMVETLKRCHPTIVMEVNRYCLKSFFGKDTEDVWQPLTDLGYEISVIPEGKRVRSIEELNVLCPSVGLVDILAEY